MESRKHKKSSGKKTFVSKNNDFQNKSSNRDNSNSQPKILLKNKEKNEAPKKAEPTITIATKAGSSKIEQQYQQDAVKSKPPPEIPHTITVVSNMTKSVNLMSANNTLNVHAFDYLQETNSDFFVIGAIGMQATGKSTILNLLAANPDENDIERALFYTDGGVFPVNDVLAQRETSAFEDEIRMHITKDRIILLDSSPVLANHGKKDFIISELEDIRRIILLLSVCHVLIILQEDYCNINFIRLLLSSEMMIQRDQKETQYLNPRILFVKNKCRRGDLSTEDETLHETLYKRLFNESHLKIRAKEDDFEKINVMHFPKLCNADSLHIGDEDYLPWVRKLRQRVFMTPTHDTVESQEVLTEKTWSQIICNVLEGYNNNYFLRKYENLKEKYNLHNHVNVVENAAKEKNYLNFIDT